MVIAVVVQIVARDDGFRTVTACPNAKTCPIPDEVPFKPVSSVLESVDRALCVAKCSHLCSWWVGCLWQWSGTVWLQLSLVSFIEDLENEVPCTSEECTWIDGCEVPIGVERPRWKWE